MVLKTTGGGGYIYSRAILNRYPIGHKKCLSTQVVFVAWTGLLQAKFLTLFGTCRVQQKLAKSCRRARYSGYWSLVTGSCSYTEMQDLVPWWCDISFKPRGLLQQWSLKTGFTVSSGFQPIAGFFTFSRFENRLHIIQWNLLWNMLKEVQFVEITKQWAWTILPNLRTKTTSALHHWS